MSWRGDLKVSNKSSANVPKDITLAESKTDPPPTAKIASILFFLQRSIPN
jgi:hypothetical protein